jgi:hypothetical protein
MPKLLKDKPVVYFMGEPEYNTDLFPGHEVAIVYALNHPKLGKGKVRTSSILNHFDGGFETMNTVYKEANHANRAE